MWSCSICRKPNASSGVAELIHSVSSEYGRDPSYMQDVVAYFGRPSSRVTIVCQSMHSLCAECLAVVLDVVKERRQ